MTEQRSCALAAIAAAVLAAAGVAAGPALADRGEPDRGRSQEAHEDAPGQERKQDAGNPEPGDGNGTPPAHAGGPAAQAPPPGQAKPQSRPTRPASRPARPAKPARPAHPVHSSRPALKPARPAHPVHAAKPPNPHAKAGKTTICHATGSATNPYVTITISDNALPAHERHQDGRDLIPAPPGGCPQAAAGADGEAGRGAIDSRPAAAGHELDAAPPAGEARGFMLATAEEAPEGAVLGELAEGGALPRLRETFDDAPEPAAAARREAGARAPATGELPFTGLESALIALVGALLVLLGVLLRQLGGAPRPA